MQYNKKQFNKTNEKKLMKKVKKQWVVVSVATLAILGGYSAMNVMSPEPIGVAHADSTGDKTNKSENNSNDNDKSNSNNQNNDANTNQTNILGTKVAKSTNLSESKTVSTTISGSDAYAQGKAEIDATHSDNQSVKDAYNNTSNGFNDKLNNKSTPNLSDNSNYQQGENLANNYVQYIKKGAQDFVDNKGNNNVIYTDATQKNYYIAAYNGASSASSSYNNDTNDQGTDGSSKTYTSYNGDVSTTNGSSNDTNDYNNTNVSKLNSQSNYSVNTNNKSKINISNDNNIENNYNKNNYSGTFSDAYKYGANYFLSNQAIADAKSGKWQGINDSRSDIGTGNTTDYYDNDQSYNSTNQDAYYQAYEGTKQAISNQFNGSNSYVQLNSDSTGNNNSYYNTAYNSVVQDSQNGIVYIQNATQMNNIMDGTVPNSINTLKIVNDLNFTPISSGAENDWTTTTNNNLMIDAQNHITDFHGIEYKFTFNNGSNSASINNFKTLYGSNYFGPFAANSGTIYFDNVNYIGPQMLQSTSNDVYILGSVNDFQDWGYNYGSYNSPFGTISNVEGGGYQQGLYVNNLTVGPNAKFFGTTSSYQGGPTVQLQGNLTLGKSAQMTLVPRGHGGDGASGVGGSNVGVYLSGATMNIGSGAKLNIIGGQVVNSNNQKSGQFGDAIYASSSTINVEGGAINILMNGNDYSGNTPAYISGSTMNVQNDGSFNLKVSNMTNNSSNALLYNTSGSNIYITNGQIVIDESDSSNKASILPLIGGNVIVNNPSGKGVVLRTNNGQYLTSGSSINANSVSVNGPLYYNYTLNSNNTVNSVDSSGHSSTNSPFSGNYIEIKQSPGVYIVGPVSANYDSSKNTATISGLLKVNDSNILTDKDIYLLGYTKNIDVTNNGKFKQSDYDDVTQYDSKIYSKYIDSNGFVKFNDIISNVNSAPSTINLNIKYGIQGTQISMGNKPNYDNQTIYSQNFNQNSSGIMQLSGNPLTLSNINNANIVQAIKDANHDSSYPLQIKQKNTVLYNKDTDNYTDNYDSTVEGYKKYNPYNPNLSYEQANGYLDAEKNGTGYAFVQGYNQAKKDFVSKDQDSGAQAFLNGQVNAQPSNDNYNKGYKSAQSGYDDGITNQTDHPNRVTSITNEYDKGYIAGQNAHNGYLTSEDQSNPSSTAPTNFTDANSNVENEAYQGVAQAIQNAMKGQSIDLLSFNNSNDSTHNVAYVRAYNAAITNAAKFNTNGQQAFLNGTLDDTTTTGTVAEKAVYKNAYDETKQGFISTLNGNSQNDNSDINFTAGMNSVTKNNAFEAYNQAIKDYPDSVKEQFNDNNDVYKATISGLNNEGRPSKQAIFYDAVKSQISGRLSAEQILKQAPIDSKANSIVQISNSDINAIKLTDPDLYVSTYNAVVNSYNNFNGSDTSSNQETAKSYDEGRILGQQAQGATDYLAGKVNNDPNSNDAYSNGYNNANAGYQSTIGATNKTLSANDSSSVEYQRGANFASSDNSSYSQSEDKSNSNDNKKNSVSDGVWDAINALINAKGITVKPISDGEANYVLAYNQALLDATKNNGANDFVNGIDKKNDLTKANQSVYDSAYDDAQKGFEEALNNSGITPNNDNEKIGIQAVSSNARDAYQQAIRDKPDFKPDSSTNSIYQSAKSGLTTNGIRPSGYTAPFYDAAKSQSKGKQAALDKINTILNNNATENSIIKINDITDSKETNPNSYNDAYNAVVDGYKDGFDKTSTNKNMADGNNSYLLAYNAGNDVAQMKVGSKDFLAGKSGYQRTNDNYKNGYDQTKQGYQAGVEGTDISSPDLTTTYGQGLKEGQNEKSDYSNAEKISNPTNGNASAVYNGVADAIQAVKQYYNNSTLISSPTGITTDGINQYNLAYNQAAFDAQSANATAQNNYITGENGDNKLNRASVSTANQAVYDQAYNDLQKGFAEGLNNQAASDSNNLNETQGISDAGDMKVGYAAAMNDYYYKDSKDPNKAGSANGYKSTMQALLDTANTPESSTNFSDKDLATYQVVKSQVEGKTAAEIYINQNNGIDGSNSSNTSNTSNAPSAYSDSYNAVINGYQDGATADNTSSNKSTAYDNDISYKSSYDAGNSLGQKKAGAKDFLANKIELNTRGDSYKSGYEAAQNGYQKAILNKLTAQNGSHEYNAGVQAGIDASDNYATGYNQAEGQDNPNPSNSSGLSNKQEDAYKGAATAIQLVKSNNNDEAQKLPQLDNSDTSDSLVYKAAYNNALASAKAASAKAISDFSNQTKTSLNPDTKANEQVYQQVYDDYQTGYQIGLDAPKSTEDMSLNFQAGYNASKNLSQGYKDAVHAYYVDGTRNVADSAKNDSQQNINNSENGYKDALQGLIDQGIDVNKGNSTNKPLYEITRAESIGANNGIIDSKSSTQHVNDHAITPVGINDLAYQAAYQAAKKGYNAGNQPNANYDDCQKDNPIYTHSFNQGAQQRGADDFVDGKASNDTQNETNIHSDNPYTNNYAIGVKAASDAYNSDPNPSDKSSAASEGRTAAVSKNKGISEAQSLTTNVPSSNNSDEYNAYWGTKDGYANGSNSGIVPSNGQSNIVKDSPAYISAEKQSESIAKSQAKQGAQAYINNPSGQKPTNSDNTETKQAYIQGYNNQKAYTDGFNNVTPEPTYVTSGEEKAYTNGKADASGYTKAQQNDKPQVNGDSTDPSTNAQEAYNGAAQAFADAQKGQTKPTQDTTKSTTYQTAYNEAWNLYIKASDVGQQSVIDNPNQPANSTYTKDDQKPENTLYNQAQTDAMNGYNSVMNPDQVHAANPTAKAYLAGQSLATNLKNGIDEYTNHATQAYSDQNKDGFNTAQAAIDKGIKYASDKDNNNDKLDISQIPENISGSARQAYLDVYKGAFDGYKVGNEQQVSTSEPNNPIYQAAYNLVHDTQQGASDFLDGKVASQATGDYATGYQNAKTGYEYYLNHKQDISKTSDYNRGIAAGKDAYAGYNDAVNSENPQKEQYQNDYSQSAKYAYDGIAAAVTNAKQNHGALIYNPRASQNGAYVDAYNEMIEKLSKSDQDGQNAFTAGQSSRPKGTLAEQGVYKDAYQATQHGFQEGLKAGNINDISNPNELAGYSLAKDTNHGGINDLSKGYQQAINDYYRNGVNTVVKATNQLPGYQDTIKGLIDGNNHDESDNPNDKSPLYQIARSQEIGAHQGIIDQQQHTSVKTPAPTGTDPDINVQAYNDAYDSSIQGYQAGNNGNDVNYDANQMNNPIYTNSFDQGSQQKGADDFISGDDKQMTGDSPAAKNYNAGVKAAEDAYNNPNPDDQSGASNAGKAAADGKNQGYQAAVRGDKDAPTNNDDAYNAYWGAQAGAKAGRTAPNNIKQNSQAYKSAYQAAQSDAQKGAQQYVNDKQKGDKQLAPLGKDTLYNQGYNNQKAYDAGFNQPIIVNDYHDKGENDAYQQGQTDAKGYIKAQQSTKPQVTDDTGLSGNAEQAYQAAAQAFHDAKTRTQSNVINQTPDYQTAYNNALSAYQAAISKGQQSFINNPIAKINNPYDAVNQAAEHQLYAETNASAKAGYDTVMEPNSSTAATDQVAFAAGKSLANNMLNGIKAAVAGQKVAPSGNENGFNAAVTAMTNALNDAKGNKNQGQNDKVDTSKIQVPASINASARGTYLDVYQGIYNGYEAGLNGGSNHPNNDSDYTNHPVYQMAYDSAYKQGQNDIPAPQEDNSENTAPIDFLNDKFMTNFSDPKQQQAYQIAYNDTKVGFYAALNKKLKAVNASNYYDNGYQAGSDGLLGIKAAKNNKLASEKNNKSYMNGYNGYQDGIRFAKSNAKEDRKLSRIYSKDKNVIYNYAYKQAVKTETRRQHNLGVKAGYEAAKRRFTYLPHLNKYSNTYKAAYRKAFDRELSKKMPRYIYNLKAMFKHNSNRFDKSTRTKEYKLVPRDKNHVLRVIGISYSKTGLPRYIIKGGGFVTANSKYVANAYYQHNYDKFKVIRPKGALVHTDKQFSKNNVVRRLHRNEIFHVLKVVKYNGITRLYIGNGQYVTSNKTYVNKLNK